MNPTDDFTTSLQQLQKEFDTEKLKTKIKTAKLAQVAPQAPVIEVVRMLDNPFSHEALLQLLIDHPAWNHRKYAAYFGQGPGWFASVLASDSFQLVLDPRRSEVHNPSVTATLEERFRGLTLHGLMALQTMMDNPKVQDASVLKAVEIGIKALGLGVKDPDEEKIPVAESLDRLADRLTNLMKSKGKGTSLIEHRTQQDLTAYTRRSVKDHHGELVLATLKDAVEVEVEAEVEAEIEVVAAVTTEGS